MTKAKKKIRSLSLLLAINEKDNQQDMIDLEFLENLLNQVHKSYSSYVDYNSSEDAHNQLFVWPYLDAIAKSMTIGNCNSDFVQGQPFLNSMTQQLKSVDLFVNDRNQYKSDGLIKLLGLNNLELLLLKTSGCFKNNDKEKVNFDHHKGTYGVLVMLKCIADNYPYASLKSFLKVKTFFIHAADTKLHLWSLCCQSEGVFNLWREANVQVKPDFQDRKDFVPDLIQFCWEVKAVIEESIRSIVALKEEHNAVKSKYRNSSEKSESLSDIINPIILKLTKEEDSTGMTGLGPVYSPSHP